MTRCSQCGGAASGEVTCRDRFDELLALEFTDPRAGKVHFLTVACYQLQHPAEFPLTGPAREQLLSALRDVVVDGVPIAEIRGRMGRTFDGDARVSVRDPGQAPATPSTWPRTVMDLGDPDPETHAARITEWALAIVSDV